MYGIAPGRVSDRADSLQRYKWWKRPGVGSLMVLIAGIALPVPTVAAHGTTAHLMGIPTLCPFRFLTGGVPCPGCGVTRSVVCVCHGRIGEAITLYHPIGPLLVAALTITAIYGLITNRPLPSSVVATGAYGGMLLLFIIWLARLLHWFPWPPA